MALRKLPGMRHYCPTCGGWSVTESEVHDAACPALAVRDGPQPGDPEPGPGPFPCACCRSAENCDCDDEMQDEPPQGA